MTDEEINETVVGIMRLRLFGEESRAPEQVKEVLLRLIRTTYTQAIETSIEPRSFKRGNISPSECSRLTFPKMLLSRT